jgi:DNA-binding transcriptional LysR family regulator
MGLARPPFDRDVFDSHLLYRESMMLAVPAGHRLADLTRPIEDADLRDEPLIMHSPTKAAYFYDLVVRMHDIQHRNVLHTVSQILTMVSLVAARRGVAFVPHSATLLAIKGVEFLPLAGGGSEDAVELHAIWNRKVANPALRRLLQDLEFRTE